MDKRQEGLLDQASACINSARKAYSEAGQRIWLMDAAADLKRIIDTLKKD